MVWNIDANLFETWALTSHFHCHYKYHYTSAISSIFAKVESINKQVPGSHGASKIVGQIWGRCYTHKKKEKIPISMVNVGKNISRHSPTN